MKCAADFRRIARESLSGKWLIAVLAGVVAMLLGAAAWDGPECNVDFNGVGVQANLEIFGQNVLLFDMDQGLGLHAFGLGVLMYIAILILVIAILQAIIGMIVVVGYARFNLDLVDGGEVSIGTLFQYFPQWKTMVIAGLLQTLYVVLWTLLFIIPGIIASYRYAMTNYILAENPEMKASEAIDRSKEMMDGNKWRLFCLHFSFIGWVILCTFTLGIGNLWLNPYMEAANAAFYRDITAPTAEEKTEVPLLPSAD